MNGSEIQKSGSGYLRAHQLRSEYRCMDGRAKESALTRFEVGLAVIACSLIALACTESSTAVEIPGDHSLAPEAYLALGVPGVGSSWESGEFAEAIAALNTIERDKLPRSGSARSGLLFAELVAAARRQSAPGRDSLRDLYGFSSRDQFYFDLEYAEIAAASLDAVLAAAPTLAELQASKEFQTREYSRAESDESRRQIAESIGDTDLALAEVSRLTAGYATQVAMILRQDETSEVARRVACDSLAGSAEGIRERTSERDRSQLSAIIAGLGRMTINAPYKQRLSEVVEALKSP